MPASTATGAARGTAAGTSAKTAHAPAAAKTTTGRTESSSAPHTAQTPEERRALLDKRLNDSLDSFDAKLRREQQKIAQERDARKATVSTAASASGTADPQAKSTPPAAPAKNGKRAGDPKAPRERAGELKSEKSSGTASNPDANGLTPREIPDGNDDDIVARRLRKAAEQETDPELRERLWKEYVEYKRNSDTK